MTSPFEPAAAGQIVFVAATAEDMKALGRRLGEALQVGDVVGLQGTLGAGKTTLAQGIANGAGVPFHRHVASPTFALLNLHPGRIPFAHADLYRLKSDAELAEMGLDELFDESAAVIEWVDRFPTAVPGDHLHIQIDVAADGSRTLRIAARGTRAARLLSAISDGGNDQPG